MQKRQRVTGVWPLMSSLARRARVFAKCVSHLMAADYLGIEIALLATFELYSKSSTVKDTRVRVKVTATEVCNDWCGNKMH